MPTKPFYDTVREHLQQSELFRRSMLREAVVCIILGDGETGQTLLQKYIMGTIGFTQLGLALKRTPRSLLRMCDPASNPQAKNLFQVVACLLQAEFTSLEVLDKAAA